MTTRCSYRVREGLLGNTGRAKVLLLAILFLLIGKILFAADVDRTSFDQPSAKSSQAMLDAPNPPKQQTSL